MGVRRSDEVEHTAKADGLASAATAEGSECGGREAGRFGDDLCWARWATCRCRSARRKFAGARRWIVRVSILVGRGDMVGELGVMSCHTVALNVAAKDAATNLVDHAAAATRADVEAPAGEQRATLAVVLDSTLGSGLGTSSAARMRASFRTQQALARKPKWRMRRKPLGKTCVRKRRMNSLASSVIALDLFWAR